LRDAWRRQIHSDAPLMPGAAAKSRYHSKAGVDKGLRTVANVSVSLWGRNFSREHDRRVGEGVNARKRGQAPRQMRAELKAATEAAKHGDGK